MNENETEAGRDPAATLTLKVGEGSYTFHQFSPAVVEALSPLLNGFLELSFSGHVWPSGLPQIDSAFHSMWRKILEHVCPLLAQTPADCAMFWPRHSEQLLTFWREALNRQEKVN